MRRQFSALKQESREKGEERCAIQSPDQGGPSRGVDQIKIGNGWKNNLLTMEEKWEEGGEE